MWSKILLESLFSLPKLSWLLEGSLFNAWTKGYSLQISFLRSTNSKCQSSYYCFNLLVNVKTNKKLNRNIIRSKLKALGIGTSIYYPNPVPFMTYYKNKYRAKINEFYNSSLISNNSIALPVGPHIKTDEAEYIAENILQIIS